MFFLLSIISISLYAAESDGTTFCSILLPGQNGGGGSTFYQTGVMNTAGYKCNVPKEQIDLGQGHCVEHFKKHLQLLPPSSLNQRLLLYGISQGTATLIRWLSEQPIAEQKERVGCLVLEGVLGSGNRAILHTVHSIPVVGSLIYFPFARLWLPWLTKAIVFRAYDPWGPQALDHIKNIAPDIPVVIMHNGKDFQLPVNDAYEAYCRFKENGNPVYLFADDTADTRPTHFDVLYYDRNSATKVAALQAVYDAHNLPFNQSLCTGDPKEIDLNPYRPSIVEVKCWSERHERWQRYAQNVIDATTAACIVLYVARKIGLLSQ